MPSYKLRPARALAATLSVMTVAVKPMMTATVKPVMPVQSGAGLFRPRVWL
jgi:hypothetical protein